MKSFLMALIISVQALSQKPVCTVRLENGYYHAYQGASDLGGFLSVPVLNAKVIKPLVDSGVCPANGTDLNFSIRQSKNRFHAYFEDTQDLGGWPTIQMVVDYLMIPLLSTGLYSAKASHPVPCTVTLTDGYYHVYQGDNDLGPWPSVPEAVRDAVRPLQTVGMCP